MQWIILGALAVAAFILLPVLVLRTRRRDAGSVPGRFDFDAYKGKELTQPGLHDKTKWK